MTKLFNLDEVVKTVVVKSDHQRGFFFVRNGEPGDIFCHVNNGGRLDVTDRGEILFVPDEMFVPYEGRTVALVRGCKDSAKSMYTKAAMWVHLDQWENSMKFVENLSNTYRVIGYNHTVNGESTGHGDTVMAEGTLRHLIKAIKNGRGDITGRTFQAEAGGIVFKNDVAWQHLTEGNWVDCPCPLPRHMQQR